MTSYPTWFPTSYSTSKGGKSSKSYPTLFPTSYPTSKGGKSSKSYPTSFPTSYSTSKGGKSSKSYPTSYPTSYMTSDLTHFPTSYLTYGYESYLTYGYESDVQVKTVKVPSIQVGIVSFGSVPCAKYPGGVYTEVANDDIKNFINNGVCGQKGFSPNSCDDGKLTNVI